MRGNGIGFGANVTSIKSENETDKLIGQVRPEDLIKFGLIQNLLAGFLYHNPRTARRKINHHTHRTQK